MARHRWLAAFLLFMAVLSAARAQGTSGTRGSDSAVGYIDSAIPSDILRFRFDAADNDFRPTRAEFFYPKTKPGPGLPTAERRVNFQELSAYLETAATDRFSGFVNVPVRFLQADVNHDHAGPGDLDAGVKYAFLYDDDRVGTFQFRTYAPTGNSHEGLGTHHVSLEPGLLFYDRLTCRLALESELRLWVPIGGTDFAGDILRYGVGLHYDLYQTAHCTLTPVLELVGWTVLDGKESAFPPWRKTPFVEDAAGQTIFNAKFGLRARFEDRADLYVGYGRPLTGDRWYENVVRVEFRLFY